MDDIVLNREESSNILKLDDDEVALMNDMNEDNSSLPPPRRNKEFVYEEDIGAFGNPNKTQPMKRPQPEVVDYHEDEPYTEEYNQFEEELPSPGYASVDDEKADLLNKLARLEKRGHNVNKKFTIYSTIQEIRAEYKRINYSIEIDQSVRFSRRMLIACVTGVEFLNKRYNPFDLQLEGWSESVMENVDDYDGVFEELYNKYKTKMHVAPEVKLIMMLGGSAMMFHLTNSMFKAAIPNMSDVVKQNPDLIKNMMTAVQNTQPKSSPEDPTERPVTFDASGRREMQGPGLDISSLMGGIMMPPPQPISTTQMKKTEPEPTEQIDDDMSDIVSYSGDSTGGEVKNVSVSKGKKGTRKKKNEINM